jgi:hypothetical protein
VHECLLRMLIFINGLRSVRTDRCGPIDGGSEGPRQGLDSFDELLTTCAAANRLLVVEGTARPQERNSRKALTERSMRTGPVQEGSRSEGEGEPMAMCMHAVKVGVEKCVLLAVARVEAGESSARFMTHMNAMQEIEAAILQSHAGIFFRPIPSGL